MVSAAGSRKTAAKFRAEMRLASLNVPECSNVYHRPVENFEAEIDLSTIEKRLPCLDIHKKVVLKQTAGRVHHLPQNPKDIPFKCRIYEKVLVMLDKQDIDEKDH